jgi:hypothetical protein
MKSRTRPIPDSRQIAWFRLSREVRLSEKTGMQIIEAPAQFEFDAAFLSSFRTLRREFVTFLRRARKGWNPPDMDALFERVTQSQGLPAYCICASPPSINLLTALYARCALTFNAPIETPARVAAAWSDRPSSFSIEKASR